LTLSLNALSARCQIRVDIADQFLLMRYVGCVTDVAMFADSSSGQAALQLKK